MKVYVVSWMESGYLPRFKGVYASIDKAMRGIADGDDELKNIVYDGGVITAECDSEKEVWNVDSFDLDMT